MEFVTGSLAAAMPEKASAFGRKRPHARLGAGEVSLEKG